MAVTAMFLTLAGEMVMVSGERGKGEKKKWETVS